MIQSTCKTLGTLLISTFLVVAWFAGSPAFSQGRDIGPRHFIANELGPGCLKNARGAGRSRARAARALDALYSNHQSYINALTRSTSLTINKGGFEEPWEDILFNAYAAAAAKDKTLARTLIDGMKRLAAARRYQSEPGLYTISQAKRTPPCYKGGPNSACIRHQPRMVARMYANLMIATAVLRPYMTKEDRALLTPWFKVAYRNFVEPEVRRDQAGIYDFANMGMARLAFAAITGDEGLARRELRQRKRDLSRRISKQGYIDENSYRGVRALWYHTYGLDPALTYGLLARAWGEEFLRKGQLGAKLQAAVKMTALGIQNYPAFRAVGNRGGAYSTDPADSRAFVHQFALNLYTIARAEYGIRLSRSPKHDQLKRHERFTKTSGFLATCFYSSR